MGHLKPIGTLAAPDANARVGRAVRPAQRVARLQPSKGRIDF